MRYTREDACRAWLTYGLFRADTLHELLDEYGSAEAIYERFIHSDGTFLQERAGENGFVKLKEQAERDKMHEMLLTMQRLDMGIIAYGDPDYPDSLRNMQSPPALLFYRGDLDCLMGKCIAVVGSRKASLQGVEVTKKICRELSRRWKSHCCGACLRH